MRWLRRKPKPEPLLNYTGLTRNPVHDTLWPECRKPLPHGHHLFHIVRAKAYREDTDATD